MEANSNKKHVSTENEFIEEVLNITDDYKAKEISEETVRYYIQFWDNNSGEMLFYGEKGLNPTFVQRVGNKRLDLVDQMFDVMQLTIDDKSGSVK